MSRIHGPGLPGRRTTITTQMENGLTEFFAYPFDTDEAYQVGTILKLEYQGYIVHIQ